MRCGKGPGRETAVDAYRVSVSRINEMLPKPLFLILFLVCGLLNQATGDSSRNCFAFSCDGCDQRPTVQLSKSQEFHLSKTLRTAIIPPSIASTVIDRGFQLDDRCNSICAISGHTALLHLDSNFNEVLNAVSVSSFSYRLPPFSAYEILLI